MRPRFPPHDFSASDEFKSRSKLQSQTQIQPYQSCLPRKSLKQVAKEKMIYIFNLTKQEPLTNQSNFLSSKSAILFSARHLFLLRLHNQILFSARHLLLLRLHNQILFSVSNPHLKCATEGCRVIKFGLYVVYEHTASRLQHPHLHTIPM